MVFELRRRLIDVRKIPIFRIFFKESVFWCIVRENYTGVVAEHLNRSKVKSYFFVNKNYHSGVLTYLWERDLILCGVPLRQLTRIRDLLRAGELIVGSREKKVPFAFSSEKKVTLGSPRNASIR